MLEFYLTATFLNLLPHSPPQIVPPPNFPVALAYAVESLEMEEVLPLEKTVK